MANIDARVVIASIFAIVLILAILKYGRLSASMRVFGARMTMKGENPQKPAPAKTGIFRNFTIGIGRFKTTGGGTIAENTTIGSGEYQAEMAKDEQESHTEKKIKR